MQDIEVIVTCEAFPCASVCPEQRAGTMLATYYYYYIEQLLSIIIL